jgi:subtilisin family serine protease
MLHLFLCLMSFVFSSLLLEAKDYQGFIVKFKNKSSLVNSLSKSNQGFKNFPNLYYLPVSPAQTVGLLNLPNNNIEFLEPVYKVSIHPVFVEKANILDVDFSQQWGLENSQDTDINILDAWSFSKGRQDLVVAVIDTGVEISHDELQDNIAINLDEIPGNGIDDDNNGFIDDINGWNFVANNSNPNDDNGHGTHCAGIVAAQGVNIFGVAPNVKIMPLKFLDAQGSGTTLNAIKAIDYAVSMGVKVLSNSWGGGQYSKALKQAINIAGQKGVVFVAASGNDGKKDYQTYPAAYDLPAIISVANINKTGNLHWSSNYGMRYTQIAAPGTRILSSYIGQRYAWLTGTSMAAPFVSGAVALLMSYSPGISTVKIKKVLKETVKNSEILERSVQWKGSMDLGQAMYNLATGESPPPDEPDTDLDIFLEKSVEKKWYQYHHRMYMSLEADLDVLQKVEQVFYTYAKSSDNEKTVSSTDIDDNFFVKVKTREPDQIVSVRVVLYSGKEINL